MTTVIRCSTSTATRPAFSRAVSLSSVSLSLSLCISDLYLVHACRGLPVRPVFPTTPALSQKQAAKIAQKARGPIYLPPPIYPVIKGECVRIRGMYIRLTASNDCLSYFIYIRICLGRSTLNIFVHAYVYIFAYAYLNA